MNISFVNWISEVNLVLESKVSADRILKWNLLRLIHNKYYICTFVQTKATTEIIVIKKKGLSVSQ